MKDKKIDRTEQYRMLAAVIIVCAAVAAAVLAPGCMVSPSTPQQEEQVGTTAAALEEAERDVEAWEAQPMPADAAELDAHLADYETRLARLRDAHEAHVASIRGSVNVEPLPAPPGLPLEWRGLWGAGAALLTWGAGKFIGSKRYRQHVLSAFKALGKLEIVKATRAALKAGGALHTGDTPASTMENLYWHLKEHGSPAEQKFAKEQLLPTINELRKVKGLPPLLPLEV